MSANKTHIILNPTSGGGMAGRNIPGFISEAEKRFGNQFLLHVTRAPLEATHLAHEAAEAGAELIIAAGGDGTVHEIVNGLFKGKDLINPFCVLGILDFGTGKGIAQTLGLPKSYPDQLDYIINNAACPVDIGYIRYKNSHGDPCGRCFINDCQIGIGSAVVKRVHAGYKKLGGRMAFGMVAMSQVIFYKSNRITFHLDDQAPVTEKLIGLVISNGNYCAGGMQLNPDARPDDGYFDILYIHEMTIPERLISFPKIYPGKHLPSKHFTSARNKKIALASDEALWIEADGELVGMLPCDIEILPSILNVKYKPIKPW